MKKLLVQNCVSKFFKNIINVTIDDCNIIGSNINNNLYQLYYTYNFTHILFKAELINKEILQFIQDFSNNGVRCFVHHSSLVPNLIKDLQNYNITHFSDKKYDNTIHIPNNLINTRLFFDNSSIRSDSIVCFCEFIVLPEFLNDYLYPKTSLPIKLFNNGKIAHPQNLGLISEQDRANILQTNKYYLALSEDDQYILEAQHCGCIVLQVTNLNDYIKVPYSAPQSSIEYVDFVKDKILL